MNIIAILEAAVVIGGFIFFLDIMHNGKIDLPHKRAKRKYRDPFSKFLLKIGNKLESAYEQRKRAWNFRARK